MADMPSNQTKPNQIQIHIKLDIFTFQQLIFYQKGLKYYIAFWEETGSGIRGKLPSFVGINFKKLNKHEIK